MSTELTAADNLAQTIRQVAKKARSEEDLRVGVERALGATLQALGLTATPEYEKTTFSGSADAVYGHLTIEYKRPGRLAGKDLPAITEQIARYLTDQARRAGGKTKQAEALEKMIGVGLDGEQILFLRYSAAGRKRESPLDLRGLTDLGGLGLPGSFQMVGPVEVGRESIELLLLYLRSLSRKPLYPEGLAKSEWLSFYATAPPRPPRFQKPRRSPGGWPGSRRRWTRRRQSCGKSRTGS